MKLGHVASHSVVQIVIAWNREGLGTFPPPSREAFACNRRRCLRTRLGVINLLIGKWPGAVRTRISTVLLLSFRLRQPPIAVADEHLFEFGAGTEIGRASCRE